MAPTLLGRSAASERNYSPSVTCIALNVPESYIMYVYLCSLPYHRQVLFGYYLYAHDPVQYMLTVRLKAVPSSVAELPSFWLEAIFIPPIFTLLCLSQNATCRQTKRKRLACDRMI